MLNDCLFSDETCETAVSLDSLDNVSHFDELAETLPSVLGHSELFLELVVYLLYLGIVCVGNVHNFAAVLSESLCNVVSDR